MSRFAREFPDDFEEREIAITDEHIWDRIEALVEEGEDG